MLLNGEKALAVFEKIRQIKDEYLAYSVTRDTMKISIEDLQRVIAQMYELTIDKTQVSYEIKYVRGLMERYKNHVNVRVGQEQPEDWRRFTAVKELCHAVIDEPEDWSTNGVQTLTDLLIEYSLDNDTEAHRVTQSETLAEIAAIELMYPYADRVADRDRVATGQTTVVKIATEHGMPVNMVERALADSYHKDIAEKLWNKLDKA